MKLCVACLARTDMSPRPAAASVKAPVSSGAPREGKLDVAGALASMFEIDEEDLPTTVYTKRRARGAMLAV